ncbi:hypothetical protein N7540_010985 [Penicillium herquei]|nr:hypothetical protein N7540_012980 [Penicillium herquei]KAJ6016394.1 hypothetical protein N7540_010985 [Penicillium herquei]
MARARTAWAKIIIFLLSIIWLSLAIFCAATAHVAVNLRDQSKSDLAKANHPVLNQTFTSLMRDVLEVMLLVALLTAFFSIFGAILAARPTLLERNSGAQTYFLCIQFVLGLAVIVMGAWVADKVHGSQALFILLDGAGMLHYKIIYYGSIGMAAYGSFLIVMYIAVFIATST